MYAIRSYYEHEKPRAAKRRAAQIGRLAALDQREQLGAILDTARERPDRVEASYNFV